MDFASVLGRISRRLAADPEMRALRERLEERLEQARAEIEAARHAEESAAVLREVRRESEWRRLAASEGEGWHQDDRPTAAVLPWLKRGTA